MKHMVVMVADSEMEAAVNGFFKNPAYHTKLGCKAFDFNSQGDLVKLKNDPEVFHNGHEYLRGYVESHQYALVMLDKECGMTHSAEEMAQHITDNLLSVGWSEDRIHVMVIDPELEVLLWQEDTRRLEEAVGCTLAAGGLRQWLIDHKHWPAGTPAPVDPKAAIDAVIGCSAIRRKNKSHARVYGKFAEIVSLRHCTNGTFGALQGQVQAWFPAEWAAA